MSAAASTVVSVAAELFAELLSVASEVTLTVLEFVPAVCGRTLRSMLASPPLASVPSAHVTVPLACEQLPCDAVAESKSAPAGSGSLTLTPVAAEGPALWTAMV